MARIRIIGAGRAGSAMARALKSVGHEVSGPLTRGANFSTATEGVDAVIIATSDSAIANVAAALTPEPECVVLHLSGSLGLEVLGTHARRGAMHPLVPLPTAELGAQRLLSGVTFAVAGDELVQELVTSLGGTFVTVADEDRARYHAAACIAANHVVALLGQVERIGREAGLSVDAFLDLTRAAVDDVAALGPQRALTGPAARGDWATLERHLEAIDESERASYRAGVGLALELSATHFDALGLEEEPVDELLEVRAVSLSSLA